MCAAVAFLLLIAAINLVILRGLLRVFRDMRRGEYDEETLEQHLNNRGLMNRVLGRATRAVRTDWHMYPLGFLFGLGFDTVTEVGLLVMAAGSVASGLPWYAVVCLPVLFAAGMSLLDTIDGSFMNFAYGWAFSKPVRKVYYNITITSLSVLVALVIGGVELLGLLSQQLNINGRFWTAMQNADINTLGFVIVGIFVATWAVALLVWRLGRIRWVERLTVADAHVVRGCLADGAGRVDRGATDRRRPGGVRGGPAGPGEGRLRDVRRGAEAGQQRP